MNTIPDSHEYCKRMINEQIIKRGVTDQRVIAAMSSLPRHLFITDYPIQSAYGDYPLTIGHGQTISQPYIVALMLELCELQGHEKVLEIGTGSGYQTALLAYLTREVYSIELLESLYHQASSSIKQLNIPETDKVQLIFGDGYQGWPEKAPFDRIILSAAPPSLPQTLVDQLDEGGIMVAPIGVGNQSLLKITKKENELVKEYAGGVRFVPMCRGRETNK